VASVLLLSLFFGINNIHFIPFLAIFLNGLFDLTHYDKKSFFYRNNKSSLLSNYLASFILDYLLVAVVVLIQALF